MTRRPWTPDEVAVLTAAYPDTPTEALARSLGRTAQQVYMQATGTHPAPCARFCEAAAFQIELRRLRQLLRDALPHVAASAEASHLTDGFRRKPDNDLDRLTNRIMAELHNVQGKEQTPQAAVPLDPPVGRKEE